MGHGSSQDQSPDQRQPEVAPTSVPGSCGGFKGGFLVAWGTQQAEDRGFFQEILMTFMIIHGKSKINEHPFFSSIFWEHKNYTDLWTFQFSIASGS